MLPGTDPFVISARDKVIALTRYMAPAIYPFREDALAGGLVSYGASNRDAFRLVGHFAGRILGGGNPADLLVQQPTRLEMVVNLRTANMLGLTVPMALLACADKVVE